MASIYEISTWVGGTVASKNAVYFYSDKYYYSLNDANHDTPSLGAAKWGGYTTYNNATIPHFFWVPDYGTSVSSEPQVDVIQFGDGYEQRAPQNISADLLKVDVAFDNRDEKEVTAMAHFLHTRGAKDAFAFTPPSPYGSMKKFVCRTWDISMNFHNNFSLKASFEEVVS